MLHDLRLAIASLRRESLLSFLVVLILAASLGVHTAVFSLVNAAFFRPLPYQDAERLVVIESVSSKTGGVYGLSIPDADDYRAEARLLDEVGAFTARRDNLIAADGRVTSVPSALVTAGVLPATGVRPALGRLIEPTDDRQGGDSFKVVIGHGLWRGRFGADPEVLGRTLKTSLGTFEVIGVLPAGFGFPEGAQMWLPYQSWIDTQDSGDTREDQRSMRWPRGLGRLAEGSSLEQAQQEVDGLAASLAERFPKTNGIWQPRVTAYREHTTSGLATHLRSLFALTWVFMALAAVNLAGLQLARGVARTASFSLQRALGASGARLGRQLFSETLLLALPGAAGGLVLAKVLLALLPRLVPTSLPSWLDVRLGAVEIGLARLGRHPRLAPTAFGQLVARVHGELRAALVSGRALVVQLSSSLGSLLALVGMYYCCTQAIGSAMTPAQALLVVPGILVATTLPLTVGGWGVRELSAMALFELASIPAAQGAASSVLFGAVSLVSALPGLVPLVLTDRGAASPDA